MVPTSSPNGNSIDQISNSLTVGMIVDIYPVLSFALVEAVRCFDNILKMLTVSDLRNYHPKPVYLQ